MKLCPGNSPMDHVSSESAAVGYSTSACDINYDSWSSKSDTEALTLPREIQAWKDIKTNTSILSFLFRI